VPGMTQGPEPWKEAPVSASIVRILWLTLTRLMIFVCESRTTRIDGTQRALPMTDKWNGYWEKRKYRYKLRLTFRYPMGSSLLRDLHFTHVTLCCSLRLGGGHAGGCVEMRCPSLQVLEGVFNTGRFLGVGGSCKSMWGV
jgi:hypothetical protein